MLAILTGILQFVEYRFFVHDLSTEVYIGVIAVFFTVLGIWVGLKLTKGKRSFQPQKAIDTQIDIGLLLNKHGISQREFEVLTLIAKGQSNKEIADSLFLSTNTVKTHSSNIFAKLDVKRRTQAVQRAVEIGLLNEESLSN